METHTLCTLILDPIQVSGRCSLRRHWNAEVPTASLVWRANHHPLLPFNERDMFQRNNRSCPLSLCFASFLQTAFDLITINNNTLSAHQAMLSLQPYALSLYPDTLFHWKLLDWLKRAVQTLNEPLRLPSLTEYVSNQQERHSLLLLFTMVQKWKALQFITRNSRGISVPLRSS